MTTLKVRIVSLILLCALSPHLHASENNDRPLIFGFLPSRSPVTLFAHFKPLVDYLSQRLDRKILMETAPDYPAFMQRTQNRHYDFVLTAPHFALLALDSRRYLAPVTYTKGLMADILVNNNSPITSLDQLKGKIIAIPPESAIISMAGKHFIQQHGLKTSRFKITNSHNDSLHTLLSGDVDAAIVSYNVTLQFQKKNIPLKKIASTGQLPGMAFLIASDLPEKLRTSFTRILVEMNTQKEGKLALTKMGYPGYRKTANKEFEAARPYIRMYMETLSKGAQH